MSSCRREQAKATTSPATTSFMGATRRYSSIRLFLSEMFTDGELVFTLSAERQLSEHELKVCGTFQPSDVSARFNLKINPALKKRGTDHQSSAGRKSPQKARTLTP